MQWLPFTCVFALFAVNLPLPPGVFADEHLAVCSYDPSDGKWKTTRVGGLALAGNPVTHFKFSSLDFTAVSLMRVRSCTLLSLQL